MPWFLHLPLFSCAGPVVSSAQPPEHGSDCEKAAAFPRALREAKPPMTLSLQSECFDESGDPHSPAYA